MRKMLNTLAVIGAVAAVMAGTSTANAESRIVPVAGESGLYEVSGPGAAILGWNNCADGQTCFFQYKNGGGLLWVVPSCWKNEVPGAFDNKASSVWNKGGGAVDLYYNHGYTGYLGTTARWWQGDLAASHDDRLSSVDVRC
ncbi:peptidase inhibitor family I36 protein [Streptomyces sp. NPDC048442]|uniref:peptidase inhibitor family I36 protein n=1 Tax=Streptomyces sp. NPDC048442 TaxID=3154823 RepID=UPI00342D2818